MNTPADPAQATHRNEDPITHEPGAHPVATGVGALGGSAAAAALGAVVGGPIGGVIGALVGAFAGGLGGSAVGETIVPTTPTPTSTVPGSTYVPPDHDVQPEGEPLHWHEVIPSHYPSYDEVAVRAYSIWEAEGRPQGQDVRHWLQAEASLKADS